MHIKQCGMYMLVLDSTVDKYKIKKKNKCCDWINIFITFIFDSLFQV